MNITIKNCISKLDDLKRFKDYKLHWNSNEGCVIETTLPVLKRGDTDGLPLMFGLSYHKSNFNLVFTPWLIGQLPHTLESLYISRKSDAMTPYSHTGNIGDLEFRLEMMIFKPKHKDMITTQTRTGAITGHVLGRPLGDERHSTPVICLPDHKKKIIIVKPCKLGAKNENVKHIAKYVIDPSNKVIRWIFPQDPVYETVRENDSGTIRAGMYEGGFDKLNKHCWETKISQHYFNGMLSSRLVNSVVQNMPIQDKVYNILVQFSDFTFKEIKLDKKNQMIETSLPYSKGVDIPPLIFELSDFNKKYAISRITSDENTGIFFSNFQTSDKDKYYEPIIYIPDYEKGVLYYTTDRTRINDNQKIKDVVHYMIKNIIDWSYSKKAWWIFPDINDFYEDVTGVDIADTCSNALARFINSAKIVNNREGNKGDRKSVV